MGCSASRLDDEEAVRLCRDRRNFIKQAVEQRNRFAAGHIAYIQSLRRVSHAIYNYVEGDEHHDFFSDSYLTPPFNPVKRLGPEIISIPLKNLPAQNQSEKTTVHVMKYLRSVGNTSVSVEEWPQPSETVRFDSYYPTDHYRLDGFFTSQASPLNTSLFSSPYNRPSYPPSPPQTSQWDYFWNPFSVVDSYAYPSRYSLDQITSEDEMAGLRRVREEEGIPELEEDEEVEDRKEEEFIEVELKEQRSSMGSRPTRATADENDTPKVETKTETVHEVKEFMSQGAGSVGVSEAPNAVKLEVGNQQQVAESRRAEEETPGFTVYVNRRPTSMAEVMKDIENQFMRICDCAHEISVMLEANRAQYSSTSSELAVKMLNPIALLRSASSRSTSSRFFLPSSSRDEGYETSSDYSEDSCMVSGSHQSTLDRLYAWEKKLYEEVKNGERIRIAFESKCMHLRNQDVNGDEPSAVDRTRAAIRDLHTRLTVSINSVESISRRIEVLRDEELHPQLIELIQGLARMWRTMAECHRIQKRRIDEAKHLLVRSAAPKPLGPAPLKPSRAGAALESELRGWRAAFEAWAGAQQAYARALAGWIRRCAGPSYLAAAGASPLLSPRRPSISGGCGGGGAPPVYGVCVRWSRLVESVSEARVVDGLDFFAAGIASVSGGVGEEAAVVGTAEVAARVMWAGMSVAVGALAEFAGSAADGYEALVERGNEGVAGE